MNQVKEYDAKVDVKRRVTLRGASFEHYHVREYDDGRIELEPRQLVAPFEISRLSLGMMDQSMENFGKGQVSDPVDLSAFGGNE
ncbi:MAG: hypothetical protein WC935_07925 [Thermoleophilia bacterium]